MTARPAHTMIPTGRITPAHKRWMQRASELARDYTHACSTPERRSTDSFVIHVAADLIWVATGGKPSWAMLDLHALVDAVTAQQTGDRYATEMLLTLTLIRFYGWLGANKTLKGFQTNAVLAAAAERLEAVLSALDEEANAFASIVPVCGCPAEPGPEALN